MTGVCIVGVGESAFSRSSGRTTQQLIGDAVEAALRDAALAPRDVDGLLHGTFADSFGAPDFHARFGTSHDIWASRQGGGMTYAATASVAAAEAITAGLATVVVNAFGVTWGSQRASMVGGPGQVHSEDPWKRQMEIPFGWFPQPAYFATIARRHMHEHGTTMEQLGAVAVTSREHATCTPGSVFGHRPLTLDEYLAAPLLMDPFRTLDCCPISDGAGAYVMTTPERAVDLARPPVAVLGVGYATSPTGVHWAQQPDLTTTPQATAAPQAFGAAGVGPEDVDVYACYDPFTIVTLMQLEDSGFCSKGEAGPMAEAGELRVDGGRLPTNTHGGLLSHAYVLGIAHVVELVRQLRNDAANQVDEAEVAAYGGYTGADAATLVLGRL